MRAPDVARGLAWAAADGEWNAEAIAQRFAVALALEEAEWMRALGRELTTAFPSAPVDLEALAAAVRTSRTFGEDEGELDDEVELDEEEELDEGELAPHELRIRRYFFPPPRMGERPFPAVPAIATEAELAALLEVPLEELDWLADRRGMNRTAREPKLHHYVYRWIAKRSGGRPASSLAPLRDGTPPPSGAAHLRAVGIPSLRSARLIEAPKPTLKRVQRAILTRVLGPLPAHPAASGFVPGRSVLDHVRAHAGKRVVLRMDLATFFWRVPPGRVRGIFRFLGYPPDVSALLTALTTTRTPSAVLAVLPKPRSEAEARARFELRQRLLHRHLPQGAPTSGALASAAARAMDRRLAGLAARFGAAYTRYADDLAFSGDRAFERALGRFAPRVGAIALEEGFAIRHEKTRVMRASTRQELCGVVVNERPTLSRAELERLEAILFNCVRHGPADQNREGHLDFRAHLAGRIAWVAQLAPDKAARLRALFEQIAWG